MRGLRCGEHTQGIQMIMSDKHYTEAPEAAASYRNEYLRGIENFADLSAEKAERERKVWAKGIFADTERYRREFTSMLGKPLGDGFPKAKLIEKQLIAEMDGCRVYRVVTQALPGVPFYGLLFLRNEEGRFPLVISQHGGVGTPELCSSLYESGSSNYNEMTRRLLRYKVNVYAPQLLLWHETDEQGNEKISPIRRSKDAQLKACGSSIAAVELYCIGCTVSTLCDEDKIDSERIGMAGLSYGGLYTMLMSAIDTRIKACVSCSFFGAIASHPVPDWNWQNGGYRFADAEIAALTWPRDITLLMGNKDPLFGCEGSKRQYEELKAIADGLTLSDHIRFSTFDGMHEFIRDNEPISHMMEILHAQEA